MGENSTGLSLAGVFKWLFIIASIPCFMKAFQGIIGRETSTGYGRGDAGSVQLFTGWDAVRFGFVNLLYGAGCMAVAWALWYFWQQNEE